MTAKISTIFFATAVEQPTFDQLPIRTAVRSYAMTPLLSEPGSQYRYSNAGTNTVGCLIEILSGEPYATFLQTRLLDPLGLADTTFWPNEEQVTRLAKAYRPDAENTGLVETTIGQLTYPLPDHRRQPLPAGEYALMLGTQNMSVFPFSVTDSSADPSNPVK